MKVALASLFAIAALAEIPPIVPARSDANDLLDPLSASWQSALPVDLALQRTPPLYPTDAPAVSEITSVELRMIHAQGKTFARFNWKDTSHDTGMKAPDRFADGCSIMWPARPITDGISPSLQMGDENHPVVIYYFDAARGAAIMHAAGRGTTRRIGQSFQSKAVYSNGGWLVTMALPLMPAGTSFSVAVWNGSQQDRDGRKYFTVWHPIR